MDLATNSRFQWRESQQGVWERDLDECETFYRLSIREGNGCYPVTACASFSVDSSNVETIDEVNYRIEAALRKVWITLRHQHPSLGSRIELDKEGNQWKRTYSSILGNNEEKRWLGSTFNVVDVNVEALEWFNNEAPVPETSTVFLVRSKQGDKYNHSLFLRCPHDMTDGVGVLQLVDRLFNQAALAYGQGDKYVMLEWGNEHVRLSPCLRIAAGIPESFAEVHTKRFSEIQSQNGTIYQHQGLLGLPPSSAAGTSTHGVIQRLPLLVSKALTERILRGCKDIAPGVSVTHVFMSALAMTLSELQPRKEESYFVRYVNHSMINLRPYCCHPYNSSEHAAAAYHTISAQALGIDLVIPASSAGKEDKENDLSRIATNVRDFYRSVRPISSEEIHEQVAMAPLTFKAFTAASGSDRHAVSDPPFCPVALSSLGNVSSIVAASHGPFELTHVWAASEPIGAGVAVFLGTWDGKIELSAVFSTRYHHCEYVEKFLRRILSCVYRGLGIDEYATSNLVTPVTITSYTSRSSS